MGKVDLFCFKDQCKVLSEQVNVAVSFPINMSNNRILEPVSSRLALQRQMSGNVPGIYQAHFTLWCFTGL